jgi:signal transduction histidine kinase
MKGEEVRVLADEQAAWRRVATLVARDSPPEEVFEAVTEELGRLLDAEMTNMCRFEPDGTMIVIGSSEGRWHWPIGSRWPPGDDHGSVVFKTGRPVRMGPWDAGAGGDAIERAKEMGIRQGVGVPILVEGRVWGVIGIATSRAEPLPSDTEARLESFTELVSIAIANAESRAGLARLAREQAALRRVATLVARGAPPEEVFEAAAEQVAELLSAGYAGLGRYDSGGAFTVVAASGGAIDPASVDSHWPRGGDDVAALVYETRRPARIDRPDDDCGTSGAPAGSNGLGSAVAAPVVVEGRLWGAMAACATLDQPLPADTEARLASFTELVATAIANAEARTEVAASRARIVAATDEERRRVVRDLHDGVQQRLVHTVIALKLAQRAVQNEQEDFPALLTEALDNAEQAMTELRELAHGILPGALTRGGLRAGVDALASRMPVPVEIAVSVGRLPMAVEATAYFVVAEALTNVAKHAHARHAEVTAGIEHGVLAIQVGDDGVGGARPDGGGSGLIGLTDRLAAFNGELRIDSPADSGTLVTAAIPLSG